MKKYYNQSQLLKRGWTIQLIDKYLGKPDYFIANPKNMNWCSIKQFDAIRVNHAENIPEISKSLIKIFRRRASK